MKPAVLDKARPGAVVGGPGALDHGIDFAGLGCAHRGDHAAVGRIDADQFFAIGSGGEAGFHDVSACCLTNAARVLVEPGEMRRHLDANEIIDDARSRLPFGFLLCVLVGSNESREY
jgi:hypothetical protein